MTKPKILKILNKGLIAGLIAGTISFIFPIVPCTKSAVVENSTYGLGLCKLPNPFLGSPPGIIQKYFTLYTEPLAGFILQFTLIFIITVIILNLFKKNPKKILDLTNKK